MSYTTMKSLLEASCDEIRKKDGSTALIRHQDIPARIAAISTGGGVEKYYIYKSGKEMNGHVMTIHHKGNTSYKKDSWIFIYNWFMSAIVSDLIDGTGYKRVGMTFLADGTMNTTIYASFTKISLRESAEVIMNNNDYIPTGNVLAELSVIETPETANTASGTCYVNIPDGVDEFYIAINNVNANLYIEEIWLEK